MLRFALVALLALSSLPALAQDEPAPLFSAKLSTTKDAIVVTGSAKDQLPFGSKLAAAVLVNGVAQRWRTAYVDKAGGYAIKLPTKVLRPGSFQVRVAYDRMQQVAELQKQLAEKAPRFHVDLPFEHGTPLEAAQGAAAEAQLLLERCAALETHLQALDQLAKDNAKTLKKPGFGIDHARKGYIKWIAELNKTVRGPLDAYTKANPMRYRPLDVAQAENLIKNGVRLARALHRDELGRLKLPVPREWQARSSMATQSKQLRGFLLREHGKLQSACKAEHARQTDLVKQLSE